MTDRRRQLLYMSRKPALFILYASESGEENRRGNKGMKTEMRELKRTRTEGSRPRRDGLHETQTTTEADRVSECAAEEGEEESCGVTQRIKTLTGH